MSSESPTTGNTGAAFADESIAHVIYRDLARATGEEFETALAGRGRATAAALATSRAA